jgi:hypothetical protein
MTADSHGDSQALSPSGLLRKGRGACEIRLPGSSNSFVIPPSDPHALRHRESAARHEESAELHDDAASYWAGTGDEDLAELERRTAAVERAAAEIERDRAALMQRRAEPDE